MRSMRYSGLMSSHPDPQFEQEVNSTLSESAETACLDILREASPGAANRLVNIALHSPSEPQASTACRFILSYIRKDADLTPPPKGESKKPGDPFDRIIEQAQRAAEDQE